MAIIAVSVFLLLFYLSSSQNEATYCQSFNYADCPQGCLVCPPCEVCSSLRCQTEEFCESIGFNRSWSEGIKRGFRQ